jgi:hypothetical protein
VRLRRQASTFRDTAVESLTLSIELFNRPSPLARDHAVIMMLAHSFEMLLKAIVFQKRGTVRNEGEPLSHSLNRCIEISVSDLKIVTADERMLLGAIKQDRDCATHDTIVMSENLLWVHMRAGLSLFRRLLADEFEQNLSDVLPGRVIPVSASPPSDLGLLVENELQEIKGLLAVGRRRTAEAAARLRPLLSLDGSATGRTDQPTDAEVRRAERGIRTGADWRKVLPGLASLSIAQATPDSDAQEVVLRVSQGKDGLPVRRARSGQDAEALAYRGVSPFEEYGIKLSEFGKKLGLGVNEGYAIIDALNIKHDDRAYFVRYTKSGNIMYQGLSARALELAKQALANDEFDLQRARDDYMAKVRSKRKTSK